MQLGPTEQARLMVFLAAELARRQRERGLLLNAPEAIALACDEMHLAARAGASFEDVLEAGRRSSGPDQLLNGVAALVGEIRVEVLLDEGSRLVVLRGLGTDPDDSTDVARLEPGQLVLGHGELTVNEGLGALELAVSNESLYPVRVSSHFPFDRVNHRLSFDRTAAAGTRLDIPAGDTVRWAPRQRRVVRLVRVDAGIGAPSLAEPSR